MKGWKRAEECGGAGKREGGVVWGAASEDEGEGEMGSGRKL